MQKRDTSTVPGSLPALSTLDAVQHRYLEHRLRNEQNLARGLAASVVAATLGAVIWAAFSMLTGGYRVGFMAIGIGYLVGYTMRWFGKGIDQVFGIVAALCALLGCVLGNLMALCGAMALETGVPLLDVLTYLNIEMLVRLLTITFRPLDVLFYALALFEGYRLAFRRLSEVEQQRLLIGQPLS